MKGLTFQNKHTRKQLLPATSVPKQPLPFDPTRRRPVIIDARVLRGEVVSQGSARWRGGVAFLDWEFRMYPFAITCDLVSSWG